MLQEHGKSFLVVTKCQIAENAADDIAVIFSIPINFARTLNQKVEEELSKQIFV